MQPNEQCDESKTTSFIKDFMPKSSFVYLYFVEKKYGNMPRKKSEEKKVLYGINYASDIQRFYYYPKTKDIYTFLGFANHNQLESALFHPKLRNSALDRQIYNYPLQDLPSNLIAPVSEPTNPIEIPKNVYNHVSIKEKGNSLFIFLEIFKPIDNIFYLYFEEKSIPSGFVSSVHLNSTAKCNQAVVDIQRFVYYPELQKVFTFFGFLTKFEMRNAIQKHKLLSSAKNNEIFIYDKHTIHESNNNTSEDLNYAQENNHVIFGSRHLSFMKDFINEKIQDSIKMSNFQKFVPKENLVYLYYIEKNFQYQNSFLNIGSINRLINCVDIQQYCYFPNFKVVCSFFGFSNYFDFKNNYNRLSSIRQIEIYPYFHLSNNLTFENDLELIPKNIHEFVPKKKLIYFYYHQKYKMNKMNSAWENVFQSSCDVFQAEDIQSFCYFPGTKEIYSFYGFQSKELLLKAIKNSTLEFKDIYNLKIYNKKEKNDLQNQSNKIFLISNLCIDPKKYKNQFSKSIKKFYPVENLFYVYFIENSEQFDNYKLLFYDDKIENIQRYRIFNRNTFSFIGFKDKSDGREFVSKYDHIEFYFYSNINVDDNNNEISFNSLVDFQKYFCCFESKNKVKTDKDAQIIKLKNDDQKEISEIESNNQNENDMNYQIFEPKKNVFYLYFVEKAQPNIKLSNRKYKTIFGINFATDIQRFHYYPQTTKIYTFIGFSTQNDLNKAQTIQSLKCSTMNQDIFIFKSQTQNENFSNSNELSNKQKNADKTEIKNDQFHYSPLKIINSDQYINSNQFNSINDISQNSSNKAQIKNISNSNTQVISDKIKSNQVNDKDFQNIESKNDNQKQVIKIESSNQNTNDMNYQIFEPKKNVFYLYFVEKAQPNIKLSNRKYKTIFGINFATDIQRFHYYPQTTKIYTFIGFSTQNDLNKAQTIQSLKCSTTNQVILIFDLQINKDEISNSNSEIIIDKTEIKNDQFHYSPQKYMKTDQIIDSNQINEKDIQIVESKKVSLCNKTINLNEQKQEFKIELNNQNTNDMNYQTFVPKKNVFYLYFVEKAQPNIKLSNRKYKTIFGINFATDIQRFHYYPQTTKIYTFIGFPTTKDLNKAQTKQSLKCSTINQDIFVFNTQTQNENISNSNESSNEHKNSDKTEVKNYQFDFSPQKFINSDQYNNSNQSNSSKLKITDKTETKNDQFHYSPEKSINTDQIIDNNQSNSINDISKNPSNKVQIKNISNSDSRVISDISKSNQINDNNVESNNQNTKDMNYQIFEPKRNVFYLYFVEKARPNIKLSNRKYKTIFGINFATDIQRFHYYPQTTKIYTFIGFSTQNDLNKAQTIQSLKYSAKNQVILIFDLQINKDEISNSNSQIILDKKEIKNDQFLNDYEYKDSGCNDYKVNDDDDKNENNHDGDDSIDNADNVDDDGDDYIDNKYDADVDNADYKDDEDDDYDDNVDDADVKDDEYDDNIDKNDDSDDNID